MVWIRDWNGCGQTGEAGTGLGTAGEKAERKTYEKMDSGSEGKTVKEEGQRVDGVEW